MPTRGKAWKSGVRAEARPVSRPCQNGELADSASSSGRWARSRLAARIAVLGVGDADVDVQGEGRLAAGQLAHRAVDELVALAGGDDGLLPDRERVGAGARRPHRERRAGSPPSSPRSAASSLDRLGDRGVDAGLELERRAVRLGGEAGVRLRARRGRTCRSGGRAPS